MKCMYCGCLESKVIDSRPTDEDSSIRRRRECLNCGRRFTTYEKLDNTPMLVIKKDGTRVAYDLNKIKNGVIRACQKRPVSAADMDKLVANVEREIFATSRQEVSSKEIGETVMRNLKDLDDVAYVRFASVYRQFKDLNTFMEELSKLLAEKK